MKKSHVRQWICAAASISIAIAAGIAPLSVRANDVSASSTATVADDDGDSVATGFSSGPEAATTNASVPVQHSDSVKRDDSCAAYTLNDQGDNPAEAVRLNSTGSFVVSYSTGGNTNLPSIFEEDVPAWATSDGGLYDSEAEANAAAAAATPTYSGQVRTEPYWETSDGRRFSSESEANAHADSAVPSVTASSKQVPVWVTSDGASFDTESVANAYASSKRPAVSAQTKVIHHDAVTHQEYKFGWIVDEGGKYSQWFPTFEEAEAYWLQLGHDHPGEAIGGYGPFNKKFTIVDQEAWDETVTYWVCGGVTYDTSAAADAAADAAMPTVSASSRSVPVWLTSDGHEFGSEADAQAYASSRRLAVSAGSGTRTVWVASTGDEFSSQEAAQAFCEAHKVTVSATTKQVWKTTDGKTFPSEEEAVHYVDSLRTMAMYRLYNPFTGEHFYTSDRNELDSLGAVGWSFEGEGWLAPGYSDIPVYRLYNPYVTGGDHHYTTNVQERDALVAVGWRFEGTGWYSGTNEGTPVYRQYNPYAASGSHNYTTSKDENDSLVAAGWREEGVAWYGR